MSWELSEKIREETMSATLKATPSKAARELAEKIYRHAELTWFKQEQTQDETAAIIDLALSDLLEKAQAVSDHAPGENQLRNVVRYLRLITELKSALEPWKPGE